MMQTIRVALIVAWILFWIYWLASAYGVKHGKRDSRRIPLNSITALSVILLFRVFDRDSLAAHDPALAALGALVFAAGIALAVWARLHLGRNWGMPMTRKDEPELVTSGPYRLIRHPIYSGLLLAILGTALATSPIGLLLVAILGGYFYYCASVEERNLATAFPKAYPAYRARTRMLVPFVL